MQKDGRDISQTLLAENLGRNEGHMDSLDDGSFTEATVTEADRPSSEVSATDEITNACPFQGIMW